MVSEMDKPKVLVADDIKDVRDMIAFELRLKGIDALTAGNPEEAASIAKGHHIQVVITDNDMPMPSHNGKASDAGMIFAADIRDGKVPGIAHDACIILQTGRHDEPGLRTAAMVNGVTYVLSNNEFKKMAYYAQDALRQQGKAAHGRG